MQMMMHLTPQSTCSPNSPCRYLPASQPFYEYPSPARSDSRYPSTDSLQGLGLFASQMSGSTVLGGDDSASHVQASPAATNIWPTPRLQVRGVTRSSHSTPNILSAEYDPFAPFHPQASASFSHDIYSTPAAEVVYLPASPVPSARTSQRSSYSSTPASEIFTQAGSQHSYTPRIKMEDPSDYNSGSEHIIMSSPQLSHPLLATSASSYTGGLDESFYEDNSPLDWPKPEYSEVQPLPPMPSIPASQPHGSGRRSRSQDARLTPSHDRRFGLASTRTPRRLTTKEDAQFQCPVKTCAKLFIRSYNYKAHMETHDSSREYPFPCPLPDCSKKFVRKTDLQRHNHSVHLKQRNHQCSYCERYFARRDTLRRHMEDGCPRRFDIGTVDVKPPDCGPSDETSMRVNAHSLGNRSRPVSFSSSVHYSPPPESSTSQGQHDSPLLSTSGPYLDRHDYITGDSDHDPVWSH